MVTVHVVSEGPVVVKLVERARAVMNLLLVVAILSAWTGYQSPSQRLAERFREVAATLVEIRQAASNINQLAPEWAEYGVLLDQLDQLDWLPTNFPEFEQANFADLPLRSAVVEAKTTLRNNLIHPIVTKARRSTGARQPASRLARQIMEWSHGALDSLTELEIIARPAPKALTINQVEIFIAARIKVPFIEQELPAYRALLLLALGVLGPLVYLGSICQTMLHVVPYISRPTADDGGDWILFHKGYVGNLLPFIWILAPAIGLVFGVAFGPADFVEYALPLSLVLLASAYPLWRAVQVRIAWLKTPRLPAPEHDQSSS